MSERTAITPSALAEDLLVAVTLGETTRHKATLALVALLPNCDFAAAHELLEGPRRQAVIWQALPGGGTRPMTGYARRVWERTKGSQKGVPILPELAERYGKPLMFQTLARR
ncbi:hypothetical protein [Nonomuraea sp. JJY05]|uniref:hypothetical protein n=1 Tax=Nonomuraea sp. JJY05 TaxID=3350255 RepID=UPI00373EB613